MKKKINICWLRRDLRVADNAALYHALKSTRPVLVIFIFDTLILNTLPNKKDKRVAFIHQSLKLLDEALREKSSSLCILHDTPLSAFKKLAREFDIQQVFANHDYEPYAKERDAQVNNYLTEEQISFTTYKDQVIFEKSEVVKVDGTPYTVFTPYSRVWKQNFMSCKNTCFPSEAYLSNLCSTEAFHFPSLQEIGFEKVDVNILPPTVDKAVIQNYQETRNLPAVDGTSKLSVHLRFGTVSVRQIARLAIELNEQWLNELIWRDFFMMILFHFPHVAHQSFKHKYDHIPWRNNEQEFECWCRGQTGYSMVDAGMRQLNETGWMHNRVRMIVASFLTKHLLIDWRWGEAYFAEKLIDYELSSNNGNWQWAAGCGCDAAPYFRVFNPWEQTKKFDPDLVYIKKWIPHFKPGYIAPIVDHDYARRRALDVYKKSLDAVSH